MNFTAAIDDGDLALQHIHVALKYFHLPSNPFIQDFHHRRQGSPSLLEVIALMGDGTRHALSGWGVNPESWPGILCPPPPSFHPYHPQGGDRLTRVKQRGGTMNM